MHKMLYGFPLSTLSLSLPLSPSLFFSVVCVFLTLSSYLDFIYPPLLSFFQDAMSEIDLLTEM